MSLRKEISEVVKDAMGDPDKAAIAVCKLLEDRIGLAGNGWFDDDEEFLDLLATGD